MQANNPKEPALLQALFVILIGITLASFIISAKDGCMFYQYGLKLEEA
jgi:hypothetical protein